MFKTLDSFDTEFSADCVEWCPTRRFKDTLVCGTYQLSQSEEKSEAVSSISKRLGRIYILRVLENGQLAPLQQLEVPAVLDMKWVHIEDCDKILLAVTNSLGYLQIYQLTSQPKEVLELLSEIRINDKEEETLALSLDWSSRTTGIGDTDTRVVVSDSKGSISVLKMGNMGLERISRWDAHDFEAWIAAFDYWDTNIIYTGGDDCKLKRFDTRLGNKPTTVNGSASAGVTSIRCNAAKEFVLATGGYDDILRLWDKRNFKRSLSETNLDGGVWRLKWDPFMERYLLAACMYGGFKMVDCIREETPIVVSEYKEHRSISYGCDWSSLTSRDIFDRRILNDCGKSVALVGTCSFYDHVLKLSAVHFEADEFVTDSK